jgi:hypothetical protein
MRTRSGSETVDAAPASEWDYASIGEISAGLQSRKISASELLDHTFARIEALDQRLNSIVVRTFDLARDAAKAADAALARGDIFGTCRTRVWRLRAAADVIIVM